MAIELYVRGTIDRPPTSGSRRQRHMVAQMAVDLLVDSDGDGPGRVTGARSRGHSRDDDERHLRLHTKHCTAASHRPPTSTIELQTCCCNAEQSTQRRWSVSSRSTGSRNLLQWAVSWQQRRRRRLSVLNAAFARFGPVLLKNFMEDSCLKIAGCFCIGYRFCTL